MLSMMRMIDGRAATFGAAVALSVTATASLGQVSFDPALNYVAGQDPTGIALADFNNDGHIDFATTVDGPDRVVVFFNDGAGGFALGSTYVLPASSSPQDLIAGDLNNDGIPDLAVAVRDPNGSILILYNSGGGVFTAGPTVLVGDRPRGLSIGDVNDDGWLDLAVANRDDASVSVVTNNAGIFSTQTMAASGETRATALGDFDGNGWADLVVSDRDNRVLRIFQNNKGTFTAGAVLAVGAQVRPDGVIAVDLTGNGLVDIATATSGTTPAINQVSVFINTGAGFSGPVGYATGGLDPSRLVAADFDCDGILDLAVSNSDSNNVSILPGTGGGTFGAAMLLAVGTRPSEIAAADLTGNGGMDLAVANSDATTVSLLPNTSIGCETNPGLPGDTNGDGVVDVLDLLDVISSWGVCQDPNNCPADLNGDGVVDVLDLLLVISNWGATA